MRRHTVELLLMSALFATFSLADPSKVPTHARSHGNPLSGVVVRVDDAAKTFAVRTSSGMETVLVRTNATRVQGDSSRAPSKPDAKPDLRPGDRVSVRWLEKDGKKIATSVRVESSASASAVTPTASAGTR